MMDRVNKKMLFEQPFNETVRICLHFEYLKQLINGSLSSNSKPEHIACLNSIIDLANLLDRTDLPSKLSQDIRRYLLNLTKLHDMADVDQRVLNSIEAELTNCLQLIHRTNGKFAQELRDNDFIKALIRLQKQQGGICSCNSHEFNLWLQQTAIIRRKALENWVNSSNDVQVVSEIILKIIRNSRAAETVIAPQGFYQKMLDLQQPYQLAQVFVDPKYNVFPKITVGRHGLSINFYETDFSTPYSPVKTKQDIEFELMCGVF